MLDTKLAWSYLLARRQTHYDISQAWYSGNERQLSSTAHASSFWNNVHVCTRKVHIPIAAEIAAISADLLFAEPVSVFSEKDSDQERLTEILNINDFDAKMYAAAEICAALGDVYIKINWDKELLDAPMLNVVHASYAYPEYNKGILQAIHFFMPEKISDSRWQWTCERYEKGNIHREIWSGTEYEPDKKMKEEDISIGIDILPAIHIPNLTPNRNSQNMTFGRSDYDGLISLLDALDEAYSSWVRDLHLGKARLIVPREYFHSENNPFQPGEWIAHFDKNDEVFIAMDVDTDKTTNGGFVEAQFEIRSQQHKQTCDALMERIITAAGYSPQTFGLQIEGRAESGTALALRERKTYTTKARKELYWRRSLEQFCLMILEVDSRVFHKKHSSASVSIEFKEAAQDVGNIAQAIKTLYDAEAISKYESVKRVNPDWSDEQIIEEVNRIREERGELIDNPHDLPIQIDQED